MSDHAVEMAAAATINEPAESPTAEPAIDWAAVAVEVEADLVRLRDELRQKRQEVLALDRHLGNGEVALGYALRMAEEAAAADEAASSAGEREEPANG